MPLTEAGAAAWCYLFVHRAKVEWVNEKLKETFDTFIHKSIVYKQVRNHVKKEERPTVSGLLFVRGEVSDIRHALFEIEPELYLMNDCSTHQVALIPDKVMQAFILVSQMDANRIRFMNHALDYYSVGHPLVRITSGVLAGFEGYIVRISRDKCLVTSMGNMTVAISGINKETVENIDAYIRQRREEQHIGLPLPADKPACWREEIEQCFFFPENRLDIIVMSGRIQRWIDELHRWMHEKKYADVAGASCFLLEKAGLCLQPVYADVRLGSLKEVKAMLRCADCLLCDLVNQTEIPAGLKQDILSCRQSLAGRFPFLSLNV